MASLSIVAPCPKKPSSPVYSPLCNTTTTTTTTATTNPPATTICYDDDDACQELRQILTAHQQYYSQEEIARTGNPLPQDSSFIVPLHHLQVTETTKLRPRSYSVGDRNHFVANMVH
ncbi:hypothetical protein LRAMOSA06623 [Lichtheimia ramosa]|uniref:Uncharacterized protein n=1 Tax=Lichtheimia ramosa TaxID=688394 RepID=A0A077X4L7_9FUNG|nr:hypothetical protein LRAMOSA06623 [Lichtheimia ramosa]